MSTLKLSPSILAADFTKLGEEVQAVLDGGADYIHIDVMDGRFVPNLSFGLPIVRCLRNAFPGITLDVHLMIDEPVRYVENFAMAGADIITIHAEADSSDNTSLAIEKIRSCGVRTSLSIKPKTPAWAVYPWLDDLDMILVMTVEPGFGGQGLIMSTLDKIRLLRKEIDDRGLACDIEVDGGVTKETLPLVVEAGANIIVTGSAVFQQKDRTEAVRELLALSR